MSLFQKTGQLQKKLNEYVSNVAKALNILNKNETLLPVDRNLDQVTAAII